MLERMVADGLLPAVSIEQFQGVGADLLAVVEFIVGDSSRSLIDVRPILVGGSLGELLIDQIFIECLSSRLTSEGDLGTIG